MCCRRNLHVELLTIFMYCLLRGIFPHRGSNSLEATGLGEVLGGITIVVAAFMNYLSCMALTRAIDYVKAAFVFHVNDSCQSHHSARGLQ